MIAVTFALPSESSAFLRLLEQKSRAGAHTVCGTRHGRAVRVLHTGVGEKTTRARLPEFLREQTPRLLIGAGFAGALTDRWCVGDLLLAENFSTATLPEEVRCRPGKLATVPGIVDSAERRQELAHSSDADAVDMETKFIAEACAAAQIPMVALRAISDSPAAPFPAPPHVLFDVERQRTAFAPLVAHLIRHPTAIPRLIAFARQIAMARESLAEALDAILRSETV